MAPPAAPRGPDEERPLPAWTGRGFDDRARATHDAYAAWARNATRFRTSHEIFDVALAHAVADLKALTVHHFGAPVVSAGIPWYTCPFGRDALITGFEALLATPDLARDALRFLARLQAREDDPARDAEPGKIPHELRFGEMATAGEVPHTPYYGSADATPLFVVLLSEYELWTGDTATVDALWPAAEAALGWLDRQTDRGDGLVEYERRSRAGLRNQGWKDSHDGVVVRERDRPPSPRSRSWRCRGTPWTRGGVRRTSSSGAAGARRRRGCGRRHAPTPSCIEARFWMPGKGTYALALDRARRQVDAVTSNPGHLLFSRAVTDERARAVAASLLGPAMWSGLGHPDARGRAARLQPAELSRRHRVAARQRALRDGDGLLRDDRRGGRGAHRAVAGGAALPAAAAARALLRALAGRGLVSGPLPGGVLAAGVVERVVVPAPAGRRLASSRTRRGRCSGSSRRACPHGSTRSCSRASASGPPGRRSASRAGGRAPTPRSSTCRAVRSASGSRSDARGTRRGRGWCPRPFEHRRSRAAD